MVAEMHRHSHGLVPNKIIEIKNELVESFLGRINDPGETEISDKGLKVFSESALRILLLTEYFDPVLLKHRLGLEKTQDLLNTQNSIIRKELSTHGGRETEHSGIGFIASFTSAAKAISCALEIQKKLSNADRNLTGFKIAINAGEPLSKSDKIFGDAIQLARHLSSVNSSTKIIISSMVKDLLSRDYFQLDQNNFTSLPAKDEILIESLLNKLEGNWQNEDFAVTEFCKKMSMSKSQLYRKTIALWGLGPNILLKEFRLEKAKDLLKKQSLIFLKLHSIPASPVHHTLQNVLKRNSGFSPRIILIYLINRFLPVGLNLPFFERFVISKL